MEKQNLYVEEEENFLQRKRENYYRNKRYSANKERRNYSGKSHIFINNLKNSIIDNKNSNWSERNVNKKSNNPFEKLNEINSLPTLVIDDNTLKLMQKFVLTYEQNKQSTEKDFLKIKNDNNLLNCEIETLIEEKNSMKSNFQSKIDSLLAECSNLNTTIQELNEKLIKNENSLKNEKDDFMIKNEEITQMYQIATKEKFELEGVVIMLTETIKKMQTEFKDKLVCLMSGKYKNENIITNLGKDLIHMIKVNK